jgi:hypothetical protein
MQTADFVHEQATLHGMLAALARRQIILNQAITLSANPDSFFVQAKSRGQ